jgi:uncharacterized protein (TIGR00661 family)
MPSVLIGVCGIGHGHSVRQHLLGTALRRRGWKVSFASYGNATTYLARHAPDFPRYNVWVPLYRGTANGLNIWSGTLSNLPRAPAGLLRHALLRNKMRDNPPDCFITDYEPNVVRLAHHFKRPVVAVDQQSKYRYLDLGPCAGRSASTDRQRMELFLPRLTHSFACSFFKISQIHPALTVIPPILPRYTKVDSSAFGDFILIYFSDYFGTGQHQVASNFISVLRSTPRQKYRLYTTVFCLDHYRRDGLPANVELFEFQREAFLADLPSCRAAISNAGHNLISEALAVGVPLLLRPLETYDQHFCAQMVDRLGVGMSTEEFSTGVVRDFIDRIDQFRQTISQSKELNFRGNPIDTIEQYLLQKIRAA